MAKYTLPELPYDYAALEPHISGKIMELHHSKHHNAYVTGANAALEKIAAAQESGDFSALNQYQRDLTFNLGGHINHSIFWKNLSPNGGGEPEGELLEAIKDAFGSFDGFVKQFTAVATGIQGSGWSVLAYDTVAGRLTTFQMYDQANNVPAGTLPVLMLDMWEHAFYLDYLNVKADYVKAFWNLVDWEDVAARLEDAKKTVIVK
ncbi:superoxide dismutase [Flaviflexus massiliensis]|uniref:superoxide dismutase n=1 Tax=Flaviflexus massiliensis TaxID=1522309 RepID=UPI0006D57981|nr:superoxide dismutase [Flaviflexus massiliensis]